jgi:DNA mismatch repair protein MutL
MPDRIQLLPDHVANQIAAGEVVQRPASVVKELLENAIDAEALTIKLIVKDGGKTLIQVVDDGSGMSPTDARLSFERHATSKIRSAEDLFALHTKGFRGEALASIAAIAHVEMHTRLAGEELGTHLRIEGSKVVLQEVAATPQGTSISVKNLFFNIPARRNFLKSNQVEFRHITDEFHRLALAHPGVSFHFYNNGSELFNLPATTLRKRIVNIFGSRTNEKLVPVEESTQVVGISGFVCKPEFAKKSRGEQFFFVNSRFIRSAYLHHALVTAFEGLIKPDTHPGYFLYLEVSPSSIDINIHPTKTEIKFDDERSLYAILRSTVKHSLGQFNVAPLLDFEHDRNLDTPYAYKNKDASQPEITVDSRYNPFKEEPARQRARATVDHRHWEALYTGLEPQAGKDPGFSSVRLESDSITGSFFEGEEAIARPAATSFQLRRKYIVTTIKSGMLVIDQNRAHQRVLYEKFLKNLTGRNAVSQQLLFPLVLSFSKSEMAIIYDIMDTLTSVGFVFGKVENELLEITGVPYLVANSEVEGVLDELISNCQRHNSSEGFSLTDLLSKTLSRALAVKTGDVLDPASQMALVDDLFACKEAALSPFNKPVYVTLTESEIDKKFN